MILKFKNEQTEMTPENAVRVGEESVQRLVNDVTKMLEGIHEDIKAGGKYTKNDEGGYFEHTWITTGDVFVHGTLEITASGFGVIEVKVMKIERSGTIYLNKGRF